MSVQKKILINKEVGKTPLEKINEFKEEHKEYQGIPMTYAGRLDPMAEGLLLLLVGDECKRKNRYLGLDKEYEGEILLGFETDTGDILGIPKMKAGIPPKLREDLVEQAQKMVGKQFQKYPAYSSKTVEGPACAPRVGKKPLWKWSREGREIDRPSQEIEVYKFGIDECRKERHSNILQNIRMLVNSVSGDFRQGEILSRWEEVLKDGQQQALICSFETKVSSGTYIRELAKDIGGKVGSVATLYHLRRTSIGDYK